MKENCFSFCDISRLRKERNIVSFIGLGLTAEKSVLTEQYGKQTFNIFDLQVIPYNHLTRRLNFTIIIHQDRRNKYDKKAG
jgi:hypothetical protein